jgi:hypothetical protein
VLGLSFSLQAASNADSTNEAVESAARITSSPSLDWNLNQFDQPLVSLPAQISVVSDLKFAYPMGQMRFPLFQTLRFNERSNEYIVKVENTLSENTRDVFLKSSADSQKYVAREGGLELTDNRGVKTVRANGTEYTFVRFIDGVDRCIRMKTSDGSMVTLIYGKDNLVRGLVDSRGRALRFSYEAGQVNSVTQTWTTNGAGFTKTWIVGPNHISANREQVKLAHAAAAGPVASRFSKPIPNNAMTPQYTARMAASDHQLAAIFGGAAAVAAANSYEPAALGSQYPVYRGDLIAGDGHLIRGHLSYAMHLYGNAEGTGESPVYVPTGFTSHSTEPGPTDAAVTFYYPRLGNLTDVTLAVFHVAHFSLSGTGGAQASSIEAGRVRIGDIGGPGGSVLGYKHSHIEFYRGNTGLPSAAAREHLRIDPAAVFAKR